MLKYMLIDLMEAIFAKDTDMQKAMFRNLEKVGIDAGTAMILVNEMIKEKRCSESDAQ